MFLSIQQTKARLDWHKRRIVLGAAGLILMKIGAAFLVAAIWLMLAAEFSPVIATLVCAAFFFGAGSIVLALRGARPKPEAPSLEARAGADGRKHRMLAYPALFEALMFGVSVYREVRRERNK